MFYDDRAITVEEQTQQFRSKERTMDPENFDDLGNPSPSLASLAGQEPPKPPTNTLTQAPDMPPDGTPKLTIKQVVLNALANCVELDPPAPWRTILLGTMVAIRDGQTASEDLARKMFKWAEKSKKTVQDRKKSKGDEKKKKRKDKKKR